MDRAAKLESVIFAGASAVAKWRAENPGVLLLASGILAKDLDLSGINLADADLRASIFLRCDLSQANFSHAKLDGARFENCRLSSANFSDAHVHQVAFEAVDLDGAAFIGCVGLSRLKSLRLSIAATTPPVFDKKALPLVDKWLGWDRLRFLATIRIFVPAYAALTLSVIYLNVISRYNAIADRLNAQLAHVLRQNDIAPIASLVPGWTHVSVIIGFFLLTFAATTFLACPPRVLEFSRERWVSELREPELLYDHATWQLPWIRCLCAGAFTLGGILSLILLSRAVVLQIGIILAQVT